MNEAPARAFNAYANIFSEVAETAAPFHSWIPRFFVSAESHALAWRDIAAVCNDTAVDESLRRMARKWRARELR